MTKTIYERTEALELQKFRATNDWDPKSTFESLRKSAEQLSLNATDQIELKQLRKDSQTYESKLQERESAIQRLTESVSKLEAKIKLYTKDLQSLDISRGDTKFVINGKIPIAVLDMDPGCSYAKINFNNDGNDIKWILGNQRSASFNNIIYNVTLTHIDYVSGTCTFSITKQDASSL